MNHKLRIFIILVVGLALYAGWKIYQKARSNKISYLSIQATSGPIQLVITSTGTVGPLNRLEIKPPIAGRIEDILTDEGRYVRRGQILAWMSSTDRAALLDAARSNGEKELTEWQGIYKPTPIVAPLNGLVIANNIVRGQTVTASDVLLVLSDILIVKGQVDETDLGHIKPGQYAEFILDAFPQITFPAKVSKIAYEAKTVNNVTVYEVDVQSVKLNDKMRSGMSAAISFIVDSRKNATLLPIDAVINEKGKTFVLKPVANNKSKPQKVEIKTGLNNATEVEIVEGVNAGERVLVVEKSKQKREQSGASNPFTPGGNPRH